MELNNDVSFDQQDLQSIYIKKEDNDFFSIIINANDDLYSYEFTIEQAKLHAALNIERGLWTNTAIFNVDANVIPKDGVMFKVKDKSKRILMSQKEIEKALGYAIEIK